MGRWTWQQRGLSVAAQVPGSLVATAAGLGAKGVVSALLPNSTLAAFGGIVGPAGIVVSFAVAVAWDIWVTPRIYEALGFD